MGWSKDAPTSKEQSDKSGGNEKRTVWFKPREVSNPGAAQAQRHQH
jgi:hypothetical protein